MGDPREIVSQLRDSLDAVQLVVFNEPREALHFRPAADKWSARDVICHLLDTERFIFSQRLRRFLSEVQPRFSDIDQMPFVSEYEYEKQEMLDKLEEFRLERLALINIVKSMPSSKWELRGIHEIRGEIGPADLLNYCAEHTMVHVRQIQRTLEEYYGRS